MKFTSMRALKLPGAPNISDIIDKVNKESGLNKFMTPQQSGLIGALKQGKRVSASKFSSH